MLGDELRLGQLVYSKAGRDQGQAFLVISVVSKMFVNLADGEMRRMEKPKKKNVKHLYNTGIIAEPVACKLLNGETLSNQEIKQAIEGLVGREADIARQGG